VNFYERCRLLTSRAAAGRLLTVIMTLGTVCVLLLAAIFVQMFSHEMKFRVHV